MALTKTDWSVAANGDIREVAGTSQHQVIELHRFLMDLLDDSAATGDDLVAIDNAIIPSVRSTDNIIALNAPYNVDATVMQRFYNGSVAYNGGADQYSGLQVVGSVNAGTTQLQIVQNNALLTNYWGTGLNNVGNILLQICVKTRTAGADIDGKRIRVQARETGDTYAEFEVTLGDGVGVAAIFTSQDDFYQTAPATIATWTTIAFAEGYAPLDVNNDATNEFYYFEADKDIYTTQQLFERAKWVMRRGSATTIFGLNGELFRGVTHQIAVDTIVGAPFTQSEVLTWTEGTTASSGVLLAADNLTTPTTIWIQLLTGIAPTNNTVMTGGTSSATMAVNVTVTSRTLNSNCFLGNFTGALTGAYGAGVTPAQLSATDSLRALDNVSRNPPNNVTVVATGLVSGDIIFAAETKTHTTTASGAHSLGDTTLTLASGIPVTYDTVGRIVINGIEHVFTGYTGTSVTIAAPGLLAGLTGGEAVTVTQFYNDRFTTITPAGTVNGTGDTIVEFSAAIGSNWPTSGKVRLWDGVDRYDEYSYSAISGAQLTGISPALTQDYNAVAGYIPYVSETAAGSQISKTIVYLADTPGRWRLYNAAANITPFEVGFTITNTGSTTQLIRNSDA